MEVTKLQLPFILLMMSRLHFPVRIITEPFKWFNNSIQSFPSSKRKSRPNSKQLKSLLIFKHQNTFTFLICIYQRRTTLTLMWFLPLIKRDWIWMLLPGRLGTAGEQWRFHPTELNPINNQYQTLLSPALFCSQLRRTANILISLKLSLSVVQMQQNHMLAVCEFHLPQTEQGLLDVCLKERQELEWIKHV